LTTDRPSFSFIHLVQHVMPYRKTLMLALILMLLASTLSLLSPWIAGQFTMSLLGEAVVMSLSLEHILLLWLVILALQAITTFANQFLLGNTSEQLLAGLRTRIYDHLQSLPLSYFHDRKRGTVLTLLTRDADVISNFVVGTLLGLLPQSVILIGALLMVFLIDPMIAFMIALLLPLFFLALKIIGRQLRPLSHQMMQEYGRTFAIAEENLGLMPIIKSFTREKRESERFSASNQMLMSLYRRYHRIQSLISPLVQFFSAAGILLLLWLSSQQLESGQITTGDLVSLLLYGMLLTRPVSALADVYGQTQSTRGAATRLLDLFSFQPEPLDEGSVSLLHAKGQVSFEAIDFCYPDRDPLFKQFSLSIEAGETVAIAGENGSGKSTLIHMLMRFMAPDSGRILIDGVDIADISLVNLRAQIGLVPQNVLLLNGSVLDNVTYGSPDADEEEILNALRSARALEFIQALPQGWDTIIGDQGIKLSGGQKQRLALARALLKDAPILVLDEATAMFDLEGEKF
jgi:ABC-type multidrug transport system fused ATPase/permease subunit